MAVGGLLAANANKAEDALFICIITVWHLSPAPAEA